MVALVNLSSPLQLMKTLTLIYKHIIGKKLAEFEKPTSNACEKIILFVLSLVHHEKERKCKLGTKNATHTFNQPRDLPDLAQCDYFLFPKLKL